MFHVKPTPGDHGLSKLKFTLPEDALTLGSVFLAIEFYEDDL